MTTHPHDLPFVLITGMHRNGTSAITHATGVAGACLGNDLLPADAGNPTGYWENTKAVSINTALLAELGGHWDTFLQEYDSTAVTEAQIANITSLLQNSPLPNRPFAIKDPRLCRLLPIWQRAAQIKFSTVPVRYILAVRSPLAAAISLTKRNGIPLQEGLRLWAEHMLWAAATTDWSSTIVVQYESLLSSPRETIKKIHAHIFPQGTIPLDTVAQEEFIDTVLMPEKLEQQEEQIKHYAAEMEHVPLLTTLYRRLCAIEKEGISSEDSHWFIHCQQATKIAPPVVRPEKEPHQSHDAEDEESSFSLQLYYDIGNGYNEEHSQERQHYNGKFTATFQLPVGENATRIRIDPGSTACVCQLTQIVAEGPDKNGYFLDISGHNACQGHEKLYRFGKDPFFECVLPAKVTQITLSGVRLEYPLPQPADETTTITPQWFLDTQNQLHALQVKKQTTEKFSSLSAAHKAELASLSIQHTHAMQEALEAFSLEKQNLTHKMQSLQMQMTTLHRQYEKKQQEAQQLALRHTFVTEEKNHLRSVLDAIHQSRTWKISRAILDPLEKIRWIRKALTPRSTPEIPKNQPSFPQLKSAPKLPSVLQHPISVIIPVYNAVFAVTNLLDSLEHSHPNAIESLRFHIINDASICTETQAVLREHPFIHRKDVILSNNCENLGFTATVNKGIRKAGNDDVVLLNSDTQVWTQAFHSLQQTAYTLPKTASVTPLTNRGTIASLTNWPEGEETVFTLPPQDIAQEIATARIATPEVDAPTGVGFCLYITREALNATGPFDEKTFGKGYGEENDWCQRAQAKGFRHYISTECYVHHDETQSFSSKEKKQALQTNLQKLNKRHPEYSMYVSEYIARNPLEQSRLLLHWQLLQRSKLYSGRTTYIHILHNSPLHHLGGTELHVRQLTQTQLSNEHCEVIWISPGTNGYTITVHVPDGGAILQLVIPHPAAKGMLPTILKRADRLHIHHLQGYPEWIYSLLTQWDACPKIHTIHDFHALCPSLNLLRKGEYCATLQTRNCTSCEHGKDVKRHRKQYAALLSSCQRIIAPSRTTSSILCEGMHEFFPSLYNRITVQPHMLFYSAPEKHQKKNTIPRIVFLGGLTPIKGSQALLQAFDHFVQKGWQCEVWGESSSPLPEGILHRRYSSRKELRNICRVYRADVICLPSIWPETFCYTAFEALCIARSPIVCGKFGNPADIVEAHNIGRIMEETTGQSLIHNVTQIINDYETYMQAVERFSPKMLSANYPQEYCNALTQAVA